MMGSTYERLTRHTMGNISAHTEFTADQVLQIILNGGHATTILTIYNSLVLYTLLILILVPTILSK